jgi:hypothetical protein
VSIECAMWASPREDSRSSSGAKMTQPKPSLADQLTWCRGVCILAVRDVPRSYEFEIETWLLPLLSFETTDDHKDYNSKDQESNHQTDNDSHDMWSLESMASCGRDISSVDPNC